MPEDLGSFHEEILQLAKEKRAVNDENAAAKLYEKKVAAMPLPKKILIKVSDKAQDYFHAKSGLSKKEKDQLTPFWVRVVGALSTFTFVAILIGFTVSSFNADQSTKYLSLSSDAVDSGKASSNYRTCNPIPFSITGTFMLDSNGVWNGASDYAPGKGIYKFVLSSFEKSLATYKVFMKDVKSAIATAVVDGATKRNLGGNLAYMMSWAYKKSDTTVSTSTSVTDYITFMADPSYVFDKFYKSASLGAATQQCKQTPAILYDRPSGTFLVQYDYNGYYASDSFSGCCKSTASVTNSVVLTAGGPTFTSSAAVTIPTGSYTLSVSGTGIPAGTTIPTGTTALVTPAITYTMSTSATQATPVGSATISVITDGVCILPPVDYGYKSAYDSSHFNVRYNIWTLTTAYAVNNGILPYGVLNVVSTDFTKSSKGCYALDSRCSSTSADTECTQGTTLLYTSATSSCSITVSSTKYFIEARMDAQWPGMDPVYCLVKELNSNSATACFVRIGNTFVLPYLNHLGISGKPSGDNFNWKQSCACSTPTFTTPTFTAKVQTAQGSTGTTVAMDSTFSNYQGLTTWAVTGTGIPASTYVQSGGAGTITLSGATTATLAANTVLTFTAPTLTAQVSSQINAGLTVVAMGSYLSGTLSDYKWLVGCSVSGTGIPASAYVSLGGANSITLSGATTATLAANTVLTFTCSLSTFYAPMYATTNGATDGYCSMFDLVHGFAIIKGDKYNDVLANWLKVIVSSGYSASQINEMATVASFSALKQGGNGASASAGTTSTVDMGNALNPNQGQSGVNAYSWCSNFGSFTCMVYAMNTVDLYSQRINADNGVATSSSCNSEFAIPDTAWASASGTAGATIVPPTNLVQDYYEVGFFKGLRFSAVHSMLTKFPHSSTHTHTHTYTNTLTRSATTLRSSPSLWPSAPAPVRQAPSRPSLSPFASWSSPNSSSATGTT